ncbi:hypothetical protein HpBT039_11030 [Helicobacter pylori]
MLFVLLSALSEKGDNAVNIDKRYITKMFNSNLSYANLNSLLLSLKQKLTDKGFVGNDKKALFSVFDLISEKKGISSVSIKLQKNRLYLVNSVKTHYTAIDLFKLNSMSCFSAKVVYCWINQYKKVGAFFIKADKLLPALDIDTSDSRNLWAKLKRMAKALQSIGYEVEIIKEKKGLDARRISGLRFTFKNATNQAEMPKPCEENDALTRIRDSVNTLIKENDALTRLHHSANTLNNSKANPTITPTIKDANNKQIQANNEILNKFEDIVLTGPTGFDYTIKSVTKGSLYYEIKAFCDLKKKNEYIKLLVAEYSNPLDYFYKKGYKFKRYDKQENDDEFKEYIHRIVSLVHSSDKYGDIYSYLKIMCIFVRYDNKIQVELKDVDKEGVVIKPFIAENAAHLKAWFNKYQFGSY